MKPADQPEQASLDEYPKSCVPGMLAHRFLCNVNDMRSLIGPCPLVMSHWCQIRDWRNMAAVVVMQCPNPTFMLLC